MGRTVVESPGGKRHMTVHIVADTARMAKYRESSGITGMLFHVGEIGDFGVVEKHMDGITGPERVDAVHLKIGPGKSSGNTMIKWSEHSPFDHFGPPPTLIGVVAPPYS